MNKTLKAMAIALALAGATAIGAANAADVVVFNPGVVAYGYNDGYWTRTHEWHAWDKPEYRESYRSSPEAKYYHDWPHDRDADKGWLGPR
ncbi:MAG TPA: hypothetical protein VFC56_11550 [Stellaceae bacterium]|nr:hypothetical protein [Stellaceae bacterium]